MSVERRDIPGFPGYMLGSDRSVWSRRLGGEWRPRAVFNGGVIMRRDGRSVHLSIDRLMRGVFPDLAPPDGPPAGLELRPVPGFLGYYIGGDRSVWSRLSRGHRSTDWPEDPGPDPWHRLEVDARGRVQLVRAAGRHQVGLDLVMAAAFGCSADDGPPAGVELRDVPGHDGLAIGSDRSVWGRVATAESSALGMAPPRRRLATAIGRAGVAVVRLAGVEVPVSRILRAAFTRAELLELGLIEPAAIVPATVAPAPPPAVPRVIIEDDDDDGPARYRRGSQHGRAKLSEDQVREARRLKLAGWTERALASKFQVSPSGIHYALTGESWSHVV